MISLLLSFLVATQSQNVDNQIDILKEKKLGYERKALESRSQAERLQFMEGEIGRSKKLWEVSEFYYHKAAETQQEIDRLEKEKSLLDQKENFNSNHK